MSESISLTPLELAIMKSLWRRRAALVREVQADLLPERKLAYTTVMTVLDRLFKKGAVRRTKRSRAHLYQPTFSESDARADAVKGLVESFFDGSQHQLSRYLDSKAVPRAVVHSRGESPSQVPIDDSLL